MGRYNMHLSAELEYAGQCKEALNFYKTLFSNCTGSMNLYDEMPNANLLGITDERLGMVWKSNVSICFSDYCTCLAMSDSILCAMNRDLTFSNPFYHPTICIVHHDNDYLDMLCHKIYCDDEKTEVFSNIEIPDRYGINWIFQHGDQCGIFFCLSFEGFCKDVIVYYENAFGIKAKEVILYGESPYAEKVKGQDKIYSALLEFKQENKIYAIRLQDSLESAIHDSNCYDPNALLFYHGLYNPVFAIADNDTDFLSGCFQKLSNGAKLNKPIDFSDKTKVCGSLIDKYGICWNFACAK